MSARSDYLFKMLWKKKKNLQPGAASTKRGVEFSTPWKDCLLFYLILHKGFNYPGQKLLSDYCFAMSFHSRWDEYRIVLAFCPGWFFLNLDIFSRVFFPISSQHCPEQLQILNLNFLSLTLKAQCKVREGRLTLRSMCRAGFQESVVNSKKLPVVN